MVNGQWSMVISGDLAFTDQLDLDGLLRNQNSKIVNLKFKCGHFKFPETR